MTALNKQALRSKARSASAGEWIKESGDGWEAICSTNDQANRNFIIAHFEGPDALANREFVQAANPDTVLAMLDELEAAEKRIAELEARKVVLPPSAPENLAACLDGYDKWVIATTFRDTWNACLSEVMRMNAAGIGVKGD